MTELLADPTLNLYTPQRQSEAQLLTEFIDRKGLLERILTILRQNTPDKPQQHVILIGPRGMGKTTLLCAVHYSVKRDDALSGAWLPVQFAEEQYNIGDLADFWLEALRHLEHALNRSPQAADKLLDENPADLAERAQQRFFEMLAETGKRALLLADNLNDIFAAIDDGHTLHKLRALWMTDPRMTVIGAAPSYFEEITVVDQAFHDFFRTFSLERLNQDELETCLRRYAEILGDDSVPCVIEQAPERVAALRILTGGNPRLVKLGYRVLREGLDGDLRRDLERLLDEATPFFKHRIDSLAKEARRAFDAIARRWDPVTVDDIRKELRKPSNYVSAQIKRLIDEGFVEEVSGDKKKLYQVSERFYNIYYLWRLSREGRRKLRWLVGFMQTFYRRKDYKEWARRLERELGKSLTPMERDEKVAHLMALSEALGNDDPFALDALVREAIRDDDRETLDREIAERYGKGFFSLMADILWLLDKETRQRLNYRPNDSEWWRNLRAVFEETGLRGKAEALLEGSYPSGFVSSTHARGVGLLYFKFGRHEEAERALLKSVEMDPENSYTWNNLGVLYHRQHRYKQAEIAFRRAIEIQPQHIYAHITMGGLLMDIGRFDEGASELIQGLAFDHETTDYWIYVLRQEWQKVLTPATAKIAANEPGADNLRSVLTNVLLERVAAGEGAAVRDALLSLDETAQAIFEPLLLALQALDDRSVLYRIAREKRDLVLDVMKRIEGDRS